MSEQDSAPAADPGGVLEQIFSSNIGRIVAFALAPLLALVVPPAVDGLNSLLGTDFSNQQISNIAIATVVGIALVIFQWLRNRGNWEQTLVSLYHKGHDAYEVGQAHVAPVMDAAQTPPDVAEGPASSALGMNQPPE